MGAVVFIFIMAGTFILGYSFATIRHLNEEINDSEEKIKLLEELEDLQNENNHLRNHIVPFAG